MTTSIFDTCDFLRDLCVHNQTFELTYEHVIQKEATGAT